MNVQKHHFSSGVADETIKILVLDHSSCSTNRGRGTRNLQSRRRLAQKPIDAARQESLLGIRIPQIFGGERAYLDISDVCAALGRASSCIESLGEVADFRERRTVGAPAIARDLGPPSRVDYASVLLRPRRSNEGRQPVAELLDLQNQPDR